MNIEMGSYKKMNLKKAEALSQLTKIDKLALELKKNTVLPLLLMQGIML